MSGPLRMLCVSCATVALLALLLVSVVAWTRIEALEAALDEREAELAELRGALDSANFQLAKYELVCPYAMAP